MSRKVLRTLLSPTEFAARAGCSRGQVRKAIDDGRLPVTLVDRGPGIEPACAIDPKELQRFDARPRGWAAQEAAKRKKRRRRK